MLPPGADWELFVSSAPVGTKVFVMPNGMLKSNQQLVDIIEKVKPEIRLLIEKCNTVSAGCSAALGRRGRQRASDPSEAKLLRAAGAAPSASVNEEIQDSCRVLEVAGR